MDLQTIVTIVLVAGALLVVGFMFLAENGIESLISWLFRKGGISSGLGPIATSARVVDDNLVVSLTNLGKDKVLLAAIEARDAKGQRCFPIPHRLGEMAIDPSDEKSARQQLAALSIPPNATVQAFFPIEEWLAAQYRSMAALDREGKAWPIDLADLSPNE